MEEGSALLISCTSWNGIYVEVSDLFGRPTETNIYWQNVRRLAVLESVEVLGNAKSLATEEILLESNTSVLGGYYNGHFL